MQEDEGGVRSERGAKDWRGSEGLVDVRDGWEGGMGRGEMGGCRYGDASKAWR